MIFSRGRKRAKSAAEERQRIYNERFVVDKDKSPQFPADTVPAGFRLVHEGITWESFEYDPPGSDLWTIRRWARVLAA